MKKFMFLAIVLLAAGSVKAQGQYPPARRYYGPRREQPQYGRPHNPHGDFYQVKFGIVGGISIANIVNVNDPNFTTNTRVGYNIGGSLDVPIIYPLAFEGEVLYSQKGYSAYTSSGSFVQHDNYIDVPLLAKIKVAPAFNLVFGPQISFLTSTQNVYRSGFTVTTENVYNNDYAGYNKTLLGGVAGIGIDLSPNVELRGRYTLDLQDNNAGGASYPAYRNQVWQIGMGFKF